MKFTDTEKNKFEDLIKINKYLYPNEDKTINIKNSKGYTRTIHILKHSTMNCQLATIGPVENLLFFEKDKDYRYRCYILNTLRKSFKPQFLIDIKKDKVEKFLELYRDFIEVKIKSPYTSTNKSEMCIILFRVKTLDEISNKEIKDIKDIKIEVPDIIEDIFLY